jgi:hypothetical protein
MTSDRTLRFAVCLLFSALSSVSPLAAQRHEIGLTLGAVHTGARSLTSLPDVSSDTGTALEANYGYRIAALGIASVYLETQFVANGLRDVHSAFTAAPHDYATLFVTPGVRVKFLPKSRIAPWVAAGGGYAAYQQSSLTLAGAPNPPASHYLNTGAIDFGGGVDLPGWRWVGLRAEIRDFYTGNPAFNAPLSASGQHNVVAGGGLVLRLGGK